MTFWEDITQFFSSIGEFLENFLFGLGNFLELVFGSTFVVGELVGYLPPIIASSAFLVVAIGSIKAILGR